MPRRSKRLGPSTWLLWIDARGRVCLPKAFCREHDWQKEDTLSFEVQDGRLSVQNLNGCLRRNLAELDHLRGVESGSSGSERIGELTKEIASLAKTLYPLGEGTEGLAATAFAATQAEEALGRRPGMSMVDVILAALEARRATHATILALKKGSQ